MNFTIDRDILLNHLIHVQKGLPNKTPLPILYAIKFEVFSDYIQLTASNSDIAIQVLIDDPSLAIHKTGKIALPGRYFIDIIRKVAAKRIEVALQEERLLVIKADRSEFKLKLMDIDDYPDVDFLDLAEPVILSSDMIKEVIKETNFATADNEKRPILTGVNFKYQDNHLFAVATDSYRLSQKNLKLRTHSKTFNIVIPTNFPTVITFNKEDLLSAVDRVSLLSPRDKESNYNIIKLTLRPDQIVEISSTNTEVGDAKEEIIPSEDVVGSLISIAFSSKYLNEALKAFNSPEVTLNFAGEIKPFVVKGNQDPDLLHLILPVRID